jgi:hypothetical protein
MREGPNGMVGLAIPRIDCHRVRQPGSQSGTAGPGPRLPGPGGKEPELRSLPSPFRLAQVGSLHHVPREKSVHPGLCRFEWGTMPGSPRTVMTALGGHKGRMVPGTDREIRRRPAGGPHPRTWEGAGAIMMPRQAGLN